MTDAEQMARVAEVQARVACALIRLEAMKAANTERQMHGFALAYNDAAIEDLINEERIHTNAVIPILRHE